MPETALETQLQKYFNYQTFRPGQREIIESICAGRDVVALMPTGAGKSLCFQLPALLAEKTTLVVSPLIALMKDQVDGLAARGISATYLNSSLLPGEAFKRTADLQAGKYKIVYAAPERLSNPAFRAALAKVPLELVAIDEAHCVSAWGHDFRPDYLQIHNFIASLPVRPIVAAFTATATPEVAEDIVTRLQLKNPARFVRGFDRPNLKFFVRPKVSVKQRPAEALRIIRSLPGAAIVYTLSRAGAEELADYLAKNNISAAAYHAGLASNERAKIQEDFMENRFQVIVATIAFGMGVDKADIRLVVHAGVPASLEGYYQEAGRAGRDGEIAYCVVIPSGRDLSLHHYFIQKNSDEMYAQGKTRAEVERVTNVKYRRLEAMQDYLDERACRRRKLLAYFADPALESYNKNCAGCDVCLNYVWKEAATAPDEEKDGGELSGTVRESVCLYEQGREIAQIAKIRGLGLSTIWGHLARWYRSGGNFPVEKYVSPEESRRILSARARAVPPHSLRAIKDLLPDNISYEQIRLALAQHWRERKAQS